MCLTRPFKREFLQLMHPLKTPICFLCAGKRLLPAQCCLAVLLSSWWCQNLLREQSSHLLQVASAAFFLFSFLWGVITGWSLLLLSGAGVQPRASCVCNISLLPQLYSLGIKGNLRLISSSASHFCASRVLKGFKYSIPVGCWAAQVPGNVLLFIYAHWWEASCTQDLDQDIFKNPLKFPPVAAWSMRAKQLFCTLSQLEIQADFNSVSTANHNFS